MSTNARLVTRRNGPPDSAEETLEPRHLLDINVDGAPLEPLIPGSWVEYHRLIVRINGTFRRLGVTCQPCSIETVTARGWQARALGSHTNARARQCAHQQ